jgi:hypothetical protein
VRVPPFQTVTSNHYVFDLIEVSGWENRLPHPSYDGGTIQLVADFPSENFDFRRLFSV